VYLPPGYERDSARFYPLVLMLSSHGNSGLALTNWRPWGESIQQQMDRIIGAGLCPPFVMALPDTWTRLGGSPHINTPALGQYGDYLLRDVVPFMESHYRVIPEAKGRVIIGRSSGGYGALVQAMTQPGFFAAAADHSGDSYFEFTYFAQIASLDANLARVGGLDAYMAETQVAGPKNQTFFELASALTFCAAFAPNPAAPYGFDLPVDSAGTIRPDVWARCLRGDPLNLLDIPGHAEALRRLKLLFIDCGAFDEYNLQVGARMLSKKLAALDVPHLYEEYAGGHRGTHFRYERSLPLLLNALGPA
jgi:enterochelin esterase family protein